MTDTDMSSASIAKQHVVHGPKALSIKNHFAVEKQLKDSIDDSETVSSTIRDREDVATGWVYNLDKAVICIGLQI